MEYYLHWTTTFEIFFSGSSDTNHNSLLTVIVEYYLYWTSTFEISFSGSSDTNHDNLLYRVLPLYSGPLTGLRQGKGGTTERI